MMVQDIAFIVMGICFFLLLRNYWGRYIGQSRPKGYHPLARPTLFDVREALLKGEKELAVRLYCQVFGVKPDKARQEVEQLERSLKSS